MARQPTDLREWMQSLQQQVGAEVKVLRQARLLFGGGGVVSGGGCSTTICVWCVHRLIPSSRWEVRLESCSGTPVDLEACGRLGGGGCWLQMGLFGEQLLHCWAWWVLIGNDLGWERSWLLQVPDDCVVF